MEELVESRAAAERLLCLMVVAARAHFEGELGHDNEADIEAVESIQLLHVWLQQESLWEKLSPRENRLMAKNVGQWTAQEQIDGSWRAEAAGAIAWALGLVAMPTYDTQFRPAHIMDAVPERGGPTYEWLAKASLREHQEIVEERDMAEPWLWRFRTELFIRNPDAPSSEKDRRRQFIADSARNRQEEGRFQMIEGDYPAMGKAYAKLTDTEWHDMGSIATERLYALNWVCGHESDWDAITCDT
jgi:hypothetical protein